MKKKFKDTKIGKFLKEKAPDILDKVADILPDKGVIGIVKNIIDKDDKMSEADKQEAMELIKMEFEQEKEVTSRWHADMTSDSWLSKNSRPIVLLYSWLLFTLMIVLSFFGVIVPNGYTSLAEVLFTGVNVAYFGGRVIEKYHARKLG